MAWFSHILIGTLVATSIFVAVLSGCQLTDQTTENGGFCSETQITEFIPSFDADLATIPDIRPLFILILVICTAIWITKNWTILPPNPIPCPIRSYRPSRSTPFVRPTFLPYFAAIRDH